MGRADFESQAERSGTLGAIKPEHRRPGIIISCLVVHAVRCPELAEVERPLQVARLRKPSFAQQSVSRPLAACGPDAWRVLWITVPRIVFTRLPAGSKTINSSTLTRIWLGNAVGGTIAHNVVLVAADRMAADVIDVSDTTNMGATYGFGRAHFPPPVHAGKPVRGHSSRSTSRISLKSRIMLWRNEAPKQTPSAKVATLFLTPFSLPLSSKQRGPPQSNGSSAVAAKSAM